MCFQNADSGAPFKPVKPETLWCGLRNCIVDTAPFPQGVPRPLEPAVPCPAHCPELAWHSPWPRVSPMPNPHVLAFETGRTTQQKGA